MPAPRLPMTHVGGKQERISLGVFAREAIEVFGGPLFEQDMLMVLNGFRSMKTLVMY